MIRATSFYIQYIQFWKISFVHRVLAGTPGRWIPACIIFDSNEGILNLKVPIDRIAHSSSTDIQLLDFKAQRLICFYRHGIEMFSYELVVLRIQSSRNYQRLCEIAINGGNRDEERAKHTHDARMIRL